MASKTSRKRTYDKPFLKLGFTEKNEKLKCVGETGVQWITVHSESPFLKLKISNNILG